MQMRDSANQTRPLYESPQLTVVGSVKDLTLGDGWRGNDDTFVFHIGRFTISIPYGELS
jgi:hypothetical protein